MIMNKMNRLFASLLCTVLMISCVSCGKKQTPPSNPDFLFSNGVVHVEKESALFAKLSFAGASEELFSRQVEAPAKIVFDPTQLAYVIQPFSGRVVKSHTRLGQSVRPGTPLFEVASADFIEAQKEFFQARSERELAFKDLQRKEELHKNGVTSQRELEEAVNAFSLADKEYHNAMAAVKIFHSDPENMIVGEPLVIRSPIAGEVIENQVVLGQFFNGEEEAVIVANQQKMWIEAYVSEKDIRFVGEGSTVELRVNAYPDQVLMAHIFHISDRIDEETRMVNVRAECDNPGKLLKAGMFATVVITATAQSRMMVPETAIMQGERQNFVFVRTGETSFAKRYVDVETIIDGKAVLTSGLQADEEIINNGGIYIISDGGFFIR
jgi:cobalt-zinc-cadmium efflux system membrane fusion protein